MVCGRSQTCNWRVVALSKGRPAISFRKGTCRCGRSKWHLGFYNWASTPTFRGFNSFYGFYTGGEDYFTHNAGGYDFHRDPSPRCHQANCSQVAWQDKGKYSTIAFASEAVDVITAHPVAEAPLFLYLACQAVHAPPEVPKYYVPIYGSCVYPLFRTAG